MSDERPIWNSVEAWQLHCKDLEERIEVLERECERLKFWNDTLKKAVPYEKAILADDAPPTEAQGVEA